MMEQLSVDTPQYRNSAPECKHWWLSSSQSLHSTVHKLYLSVSYGGAALSQHSIVQKLYLSANTDKPIGFVGLADYTY